MMVDIGAVLAGITEAGVAIIPFVRGRLLCCDDEEAID